MALNKINLTQIDTIPPSGTTIVFGSDQLPISEIFAENINIYGSLFLDGNPNGFQGLQGNQGPIGLQGTTGSQGISGTTGSQGNQGPIGLQGTTGLQGNQGPTGLQGISGTTGLQGNQGPTGVQGQTGLQGNQGTTGFQGNQGPTGLQGTTGSQGNQGPTGLQGTTGSQGNQGPTGLQGISGTTGFQGNQGPTGLQGISGTTGLQGTTGSQGNQGPTGLQGTTGSQGNQGPTGLQGISGTTGLQGTTGSQGNQGPTGLQGISGTTGLQGISGTTGLQGTTGSQGNQGFQGIQGVNGTSAGGLLLFLNYIEDSSPTATPLTSTQLGTITGESFQAPSSITYSPTENIHVSQLLETPVLSDPQTSILFSTPASNTVDVPIVQFGISISGITGNPDHIPPGIWDLNIHTKTNSNSDNSNIGLRFYLLGRTSGGTYTNLISGGSDIEYIFDHVVPQKQTLSLIVPNILNISGYTELHVVLTSRNRNSSSHQAFIYFQNNTYSHIHTSFVSEGPVGAQGMTGLQGTTGSQGNQGPTGVQGTVGTQGATGASAGITSYTNPLDNRVITSVSSTSINAETNLTFDGTTLTVVAGDLKITAGSISVGGNLTNSVTDGRIDASNDIVAFSTSDRRLKENINNIQNPIEKILKLNGVEFDWIKEHFDIHGYEGNDVGVIAQDLKDVLPQALRINDSGYYAVRYEKIIPLLIECIKELNNEIKILKEK